MSPPRCCSNQRSRSAASIHRSRTLQKVPLRARTRTTTPRLRRGSIGRVAQVSEKGDAIAVLTADIAAIEAEIYAKQHSLEQLRDGVDNLTSTMLRSWEPRSCSRAELESLIERTRIAAMDEQAPIAAEVERLAQLHKKTMAKYWELYYKLQWGSDQENAQVQPAPARAVPVEPSSSATHMTPVPAQARNEVASAGAAATMDHHYNLVSLGAGIRSSIGEYDAIVNEHIGLRTSHDLTSPATQAAAESLQRIASMAEDIGVTPLRKSQSRSRGSGGKNNKARSSSLSEPAAGAKRARHAEPGAKHGGKKRSRKANGHEGKAKPASKRKDSPPAGPSILGKVSAALSLSAASNPSGAGPQPLEAPVASSSSNAAQPEAVVCKCKKSRCLKLYCDCFASGAFCSDVCTCADCMNTDCLAYSRDREIAVQAVLQRRPDAFSSKVTTTVATQDAQAEVVVDLHVTGCKCRRSACLKKYCVCFGGRLASFCFDLAFLALLTHHGPHPPTAGVQCSYMCRCVGCQNGNDGQGVLEEDLAEV